MVGDLELRHLGSEYEHPGPAAGVFLLSRAWGAWGAAACGRGAQKRNRTREGPVLTSCDARRGLIPKKIIGKNGPEIKAGGEEYGLHPPSKLAYLPPCKQVYIPGARFSDGEGEDMEE